MISINLQNLHLLKLQENVLTIIAAGLHLWYLPFKSNSTISGYNVQIRVTKFASQSSKYDTDRYLRYLPSREILWSRVAMFKPRLLIYTL